MTDEELEYKQENGIYDENEWIFDDDDDPETSPTPVKK